MTAPLIREPLERSLEKHLFQRVRRMGGICLKMAPTQAGMPDRLVLLPNGIVCLLELKTVKGPLRPIQKVWHQRAEALGVHVDVLHGTQEIDDWIREVLDKSYARDYE